MGRQALLRPNRPGVVGTSGNCTVGPVTSGTGPSSVPLGFPSPLIDLGLPQISGSHPWRWWECTSFPWGLKLVKGLGLAFRSVHASWENPSSRDRPGLPASDFPSQTCPEGFPFHSQSRQPGIPALCNCIRRPHRPSSLWPLLPQPLTHVWASSGSPSAARSCGFLSREPFCL